jgi:CHAT domain-containing protein/tetratricopeptide (TPR) repeat protein
MAGVPGFTFRRFTGVFLLFLVVALILFSCKIHLATRSVGQAVNNNPSERLALANAYAKLGNWEAAGPIFHQLDKRFTADGDARNAMFAHVSTLEADIETSNLQQASDELSKILKQPQVQRDLALKQRCLEVKGRVDLNRDGVSARPSFEELERVASARDDKDAASRASGELGVLAFLDGNSHEALKRILGALALATLRSDAGAEIRYLSLLGQGMVENHSASQGLFAVNRAIEIAKSTAGTGFPKIAVSGRASALAQLGRFREAQETIKLGLDYANQHHYLGYQVDMYAADGDLARTMGNNPLAIGHYEHAAAIARKIHFNRGLAEVNAQLASLYQQAGDFRKAENSIQASINAHREMGEVYELPHHLAVEANIQAARGQIAVAERTFESAERIVGNMLASTPTPGVKRSVVAAMSEVFTGHFALAVNEHDLPKAYEVIEEPRGRVAADKLWADLAGHTARSPIEVIAAERKLALLQMELSEAADEPTQARVLGRITEAENEIPVPPRQPLENVAWRRPSLKDLQNALSPDETLLEYVVREKTSYCLVVARDDVRVVEIAGRTTIDERVKNFLSSIKQERKEDQTKSEAHALYTAVLKPILDTGASTRLIIVPDGSLHQIPFAALVDNKSHYLVEDHTISYSPSGTVFTLLRSKARAVPKELLAVGDVDYNSGFRGFAESVLLRGFDTLRGDLVRSLPASGEEVQSVRSALKDVNSTVLSHAQATETNFKRNAKPLTVIHLAVHATSNSTFPDRAGLVFLPDVKMGEDGLLQVREIRDLPISGTSLVTLSACDTSVGRIEGQEGVSSIVYGFLYAGARSAVSTFWTVEDTATANLMAVFYNELGRGTGKAEALRRAQLQLVRSQTGMRRPLYWAAFNLMGEGADSILEEKSHDTE